MKRILAAFTVIAILMVVSVVIAQTPAGSMNDRSGTPTSAYSDSQAQAQTGNTTTPTQSGDMSVPSSSGNTNEMPRTASPYPALAFSGLGAVALGALVSLRRRKA